MLQIVVLARLSRFQRSVVPERGSLSACVALLGCLDTLRVAITTVSRLDKVWCRQQVSRLSHCVMQPGDSICCSVVRVVLSRLTGLC